MDPRATAIHLEVRLDGESPVGRACDDRGSTREFAGWMALVATIDDLLAESARNRRPGPTPHRPTKGSDHDPP